MITQIKSQWYYIFWGVMAAAVCGGQVYVGLGYREMAEATKSTAISVTCVTPFESPSSQSTDKNRSFDFE